jgi:hypothetical protein
MTITRTPVSKRTRFEVFKRDNFTCAYCGAHPPDTLLHCDHVNPVAAGGDNDMDNLITACQACNLGKSDVPLSAVPQSLADRAAEVQEREEQIAGYHAILTARRERIEDEMWSVADELEPGASLKGFDRKRLQSIKYFLGILPFTEVLDAAQITRAKLPTSRPIAQRFKFFCGVCWNKIRNTNL